MEKSNMQSVPLPDDRAAAMRLRKNIQLHKDDLQWLSENNNRAIIYAIDNDIVRLFSDTKEVALSTEGGRNGYTQIFSGDDNANAISLGAILSHHIFYKLGEGTIGAGTRLLIPPLDAEFASNLTVVLNRAAEEIDVAHAKAAHLERMQQDSSMSEADSAQNILNNAPEILEALFGNNSYAAQAKKRCALVNKNRLISLVDVDESQTYGLPLKFIEACRREKSLLELVWTNTLKEKWFSLLDTPRCSDIRKKRLRDDAEALTALQLINTRLAGSNIRLVLITGALNILDVGNTITINDAGQGSSFSDMWLRHPRCFLGDPAIFGSDIGLKKDDGGNDLMILLYAFLAGGKRELDHQIQQIDSDTNSDQYSTAIAEFQESWNRFIANVCLGHAEILKQGNPDELSPLVNKLIIEIRSAKNSLKEQLEESWQSVYFAAIQTGFLYSLNSWSLAKMQPRNLPKLIFESFDQATQFVDDVIKQTPGTDISDFRQRIEEVGNDSSMRYTTYLVFGVLFAAQNNWRITESLADNAIRLIFGSDQPLATIRVDTERLITGREAYYLKAVSERHLARTVGDLTAAHNSINLAIQMLALEREVRGNILPNDNRFEYELCSINVAGAMFVRFLKEDPVFCGRLTKEQLSNKLTDILADRRLGCQGDACYSNCRECCRILTSLFIVELALNCNIGDAFPDRLRQYLTHFRNILRNISSDELDGESKLHPTQLSKMIYSIVDWWGESDVPTKKQKRVIALDKIDSSINDPRDRVGMPYEKARYEYLRNFVTCDR
ncbi:MAG: hypothetical protein Q8L15_14685 [Methylobacter sp.]|nr:hypothetical protein [Methylobacter sp.]